MTPRVAHGPTLGPSSCPLWKVAAGWGGSLSGGLTLPPATRLMPVVPVHCPPTLSDEMLPPLPLCPGWPVFPLCPSLPSWTSTFLAPPPPSEEDEGGQGQGWAGLRAGGSPPTSGALLPDWPCPPLPAPSQPFQYRPWFLPNTEPAFPLSLQGFSAQHPRAFAQEVGVGGRSERGSGQVGGPGGL